MSGNRCHTIAVGAACWHEDGCISRGFHSDVSGNDKAFRKHLSNYRTVCEGERARGIRRRVCFNASRHDSDRGAEGLRKEGDSRNTDGGTLFRLLVRGQDANGDEERESTKRDNDRDKGGTRIALPDDV